jgi:hypothetical protein
MGNTHADVQEMLADVRAGVPVVVDVDGTEHEITGVKIVHEHEENADSGFGPDGQPTEAAKVGVGAQVKAVIQTASSAPADSPAETATALP